MFDPARHLAQRLPFFYGWVVISVAFVTLGLGACLRVAFSLLFPPILLEMGWDRGITASVWTFGFLSAAFCVPILGAAVDRYGPQRVLPAGAILTAIGFVLTSFSTQLWHFYITLGLMVIGGSMTLAYNAHFIFLPLWFERRRGLAIGIAASGVGAVGIILFPWLQVMIDSLGWRQSCLVLAVLVAATLAPLNLLLQRHSPATLGLQPDGGAGRIAVAGSGGSTTKVRVIDAEWAATDWTLGLALRTARFWLFSIGFMLALMAWYSIQIHQTKYLQDLGFDRTFTALALGLVPLFGAAGQVTFGLLSDRIGRETVWTIACIGFIVSYVLCYLLARTPEPWLVWTMVIIQGFFGHSMTPAIGAIPADLFQGRNYGKIFGVTALFGSAGASLGPLLFGFTYDWYGSYDFAFMIAIVASAVSAVLIWLAAPRQVRITVRVPD